MNIIGVADMEGLKEAVKESEAGVKGLAQESERLRVEVEKVTSAGAEAIVVEKTGEFIPRRLIK
jgi:hypothetical protein